MADYTKMLKDQYGYKKSDGYPNILPRKQPMTDTPTNYLPELDPDEAPLPGVVDVPETEDVPREQTDELEQLGQLANVALTNLRLVLSSLPQTKATVNATVFFDTGTLWLNQALSGEGNRRAAVARAVRRG